MCFIAFVLIDSAGTIDKWFTRGNRSMRRLLEPCGGHRCDSRPHVKLSRSRCHLCFSFPSYETLIRTMWRTRSALTQAGSTSDSLCFTHYGFPSLWDAHSDHSTKYHVADTGCRGDPNRWRLGVFCWGLDLLGICGDLGGPSKADG